MNVKDHAEITSNASWLYDRTEWFSVYSYERYNFMKSSASDLPEQELVVPIFMITLALLVRS